MRNKTVCAITKVCARGCAKYHKIVCATECLNSLKLRYSMTCSKNYISDCMYGAGYMMVGVMRDETKRVLGDH